MNRLKFLKSCGSVLALTATGAIVPQAKEKKPDVPENKPEGKDFHVFEFPRKVKETIMDFAGDGTIVEIAKKRQGIHDWTFAVKYIRKGHNLILTVAATGRLIRIEGDDEAERAPADKSRPGKAEKESASGEKKETPDSRAAPTQKPVEPNRGNGQMSDNATDGSVGQGADDEPDDEEQDDEEAGEVKT